MKRIYLDTNASAPLDPRVLIAVNETLSSPFGNPSSPHFYGQAAKGILTSCRREIAKYFGVRIEQIIFTSGGSEGAALTIAGALKGKKNPHVITSNVEHACVYDLLEELKGGGATITYLPAGPKGAIEIEDLKQAVTKDTALICVMAANNETGVKNDLEEIAKVAQSHRIPLIVDGVALLGKGAFKIPQGVSAVFFSGHKIHAFQGIGFVVVNPLFKFASLIQGGQEWGKRGGTENLVGIISLAKAVSLLKLEEEESVKRVERLRDRLEKALLEIPNVSVNGTGNRIVNTTNLCFEGVDGETLLIALDQAGVAVSLGSACSSGAIEPSRVLLEMGLGMEKARSSLRFSLNKFNTEEEIDAAVAIIKKTVKMLS